MLTDHVILIVICPIVESPLSVVVNQGYIVLTVRIISVGPVVRLGQVPSARLESEVLLKRKTGKTCFEERGKGHQPDRLPVRN